MQELRLGMSTLYGWSNRTFKTDLESLKYGGRSKALQHAEEELKQARQAIGHLTM
ncbi:MAG TPA: hypothetical protein VF369_02600 [candidate division Zixibacteria bacterium]